VNWKRPSPNSKDCKRPRLAIGKPPTNSSRRRASTHWSSPSETDPALEDVRKYVKSHENEVQPLAILVDLLWEAEQRDEARTTFESLRAMSGAIDLESPVFARLEPIAVELGFPSDWRSELVVPDDVGNRPTLDSLGPFRWRPSPAPDWALDSADGIPLSLKHFQGQPLVLIFYLGHGCLHCAEQLHKFAPQVETFRKAGFEVLAISTDAVDDLKFSIEAYPGGPLPIPLLANAEKDIFKKYRCYDDFEDQPLHGTFVIDGNGQIRWQDISYEPFMDPEFVLREAQRLLAQDEPVSASSP
jgi:peroxiredoxin